MPGRCVPSFLSLLTLFDADELWTVVDGTVAPYKATFKEYKASLANAKP